MTAERMVMSEITLVLRPQPDADHDVALLRRHGVPAYASPVMAHHLVDHAMPPPDGFSGMILTSRHAVASLVQTGLPTGWCEMPVFVVGSATAVTAKMAGFTKIIRGSGGGAGLVPLIRQAGIDATRPLLWPRAQDISFDMVSALAGVGLTVTAMPVYQMLSLDGFDPAVRQMIRSGVVGAVIAMSSRTVRLFHRAMKNSLPDLTLDNQTLGKISLIAGSDQIASAAGDGWREVLVAKQPRRLRLLAIAALRYARDAA